jgi:glycosyltransferase involved in cell wall biosynthesis
MITYNHAPFIARAIEGVLQQKTNFPFELVIGEDCSTDGTREIVFDYQKKYPDVIRVITSDTNVGMKKNGLRVIKACQGKYLAFCEGDDYWQNPCKLQKQADYLEGHPECGLVYSSYDVHLDKLDKKIKDYLQYRKRKIPENPSISDIVEGKGVPLTCTVMLRRALYEEIMESDPYLYQSDQFIMGDTQLWAEMATKARLHYIPESLATYRVTEGSATRNKDKEKAARFSVSSAELRLYLCDKYNLPSHIRLRYYEYHLNCLLQLAFHTRNRKLADDVRRKKNVFTFKEWLQYYGAKNSILYYHFRLAALFRNLFKTKYNKWM